MSRTPGSRRVQLVVVGACLWIWACGVSTPDARPDMVRTLTLSADPLLSIGVVEGDTDYELYDATSSLRLADGRVVVANAGSSELRFFDSTGRFVRRTGRRGGGPGEFRQLAGLYPYGADSLLVVDRVGNRLSVFDTGGVFARLARADSVSGDSVFPADVWLYRRFWVRGALTPADRRAARRVLDAVPLPHDDPRYRFAQLDADGNVWFREPLAPADPQAHWTVVSPEGRPAAVANLPRRFEPHAIERHTILGRWRDENDVNFIKLYALRADGGAAAPPMWLADEAGDMAASPGGTALAEALDALKRSLVQVVTAQEMYYADHATYTPWADSLRWELPEGQTLDVLAGDARGWIGVATARGMPFMCAMAVGAATPAGWPEGSARCSLPTASDR